MSDFATFGSLDPDVAPSSEFLDAVNDDLNTPRAIAELHRLLNEAKESAWALAERMKRPGAMLTEETYSAANQLAAGLFFFGIDIRIHDARWVQNQFKKQIPARLKEEVETLIAARNAARKNRDFKESDHIRAELESKGIILKDNPDGTTNWEVKR